MSRRSTESFLVREASTWRVNITFKNTPYETYVLEDKVPSPAGVQNLDPLYCASDGIHERDARRLASGDECVDADVVRTDPECIYRRGRVQLETAVVLFREVERQLILKHRREGAIREVVRARRS